MGRAAMVAGNLALAFASVFYAYFYEEQRQKGQAFEQGYVPISLREGSFKRAPALLLMPQKKEKTRQDPDARKQNKLRVVAHGRR